MPNSRSPKLIPPWSEFLEELDALLPQPISLHCVGGFVISLYYGLPRPTGDIDYISALPYHRVNELQALAGRGSEDMKPGCWQCFEAASGI